MIRKELFVKMMRLAEEFSAESDRWTQFGIDVDNILVPITNLIEQLEKIDGVILAKALQEEN